MKEIEVKAKINNKEDLMDKARKLGFIFSEPTEQADIIFLPEGIKFSEIKEGIPVIRIRNQNNQKVTLTLKKRARNGLSELDKIEHEIIINNDHEAEEILKNMNFYEVIRVNKIREEGNLNDLSICIDEVDGLGLFIEAEKLCADGDGQKIQEELFSLLETLGADKNNRVSIGYDTMVYNKLTNFAQN